MQVLLIVLGVTAALWLLDRLARRAEDRGWIHYRRGHGRAAGNALLEMHALLEPDRRHSVEMRLAVDDEAARPADPPGDPAEATGVGGAESADRARR